MIPSPGNTRLCENRTAACDRAHCDTGADVLLCKLNGKWMGGLVNTAGRNLHTIYTRSPSFLHTCASSTRAMMPDVLCGREPRWEPRARTTFRDFGLT